jgi:cytochrome P450
VHWSPEGFWSLTRAKEIAAVSRDTRVFTPWLGAFIREDVHVPLEVVRDSIVDRGPPRHGGLVKVAVRPRRVAVLEARIREIVEAQLDAVGEEFDLVRDVAREVPLRVLGTMLGVPEGDREALMALVEAGPERADALAAYMGGLVAERRARPGGDLISELLAGEPGGEPFDDGEIAAFFASLAIGGDAAGRSVFAAGIRELLAHPDQWALLLERPELLPGAVEELLRWTCPIMYFRRTATCDTTLGGRAIAPGDKIVMWYVAACRDEALNAEPQRLDVTRERIRHLAFGGGGARMCIGAGLGRLELRVTLEVVLRRLPGLQLAGEPVRVRSNWLDGMTSMPVRTG